MSNYSIEDLEPKYVEHLYKHIPILAYGMDGNNQLYNSKSTPDVNGTLLLQLILNYCKECESTKTSKESNIRLSSLAGINSFLKKMRGNVKTLNGFNNNNNSKVTYNKNKAIKKNHIDALGLIEGIILCTLNYYKNRNGNNNKKFPNIKVNISSNKTKLNLIMNKAPGDNLGKYIINLYKDSKITDKNSELFNILIEISKKLDYLQKNYGFIHGDFHSGNIFVKKIDEKNGKEKYIITFIDFEYSTIKLPSNKNIILTSPVSENISRKTILNLYKEDGLKALDLFHLIENLKSFRENNSTVYKFKNHITEFDNFKKFIDNLTNLYNTQNINGKIHLYTIKPGFFNESYSNLYPEIFSEIKLNEFPKIPNISTKMSSISLETIYNSPIKNSSTSSGHTKRSTEVSHYNSTSSSSKKASTHQKKSYFPPSTP
jgi:hypothetical protein